MSVLSRTEKKQTGVLEPYHDATVKPRHCESGKATGRRK